MSATRIDDTRSVYPRSQRATHIEAGAGERVWYDVELAQRLLDREDRKLTAMAFRNDRDALEAKVRALESQNEALQNENEALRKQAEAALERAAKGEDARREVVAKLRKPDGPLDRAPLKGDQQDRKRDKRGAAIVLTFTLGSGGGAIESGSWTLLLLMTAGGMLVGLTIWAIIVHRTVAEDGLLPHRSRLAAPILGAQSVLMALLCYGLTREGHQATVAAGAMMLVFIALVLWLFGRTRRPRS